jgi:murein L,D-transpeptidase YcbB/YkuD
MFVDRYTILILFALSLLQLPVSVAATSLPVAVHAEIAARLTGEINPPAVWLGGALTLDGELLPEFYARRQYAPAWLDDLGLTANAEELLKVIRDSARHGLCADDFRLSFIDPLVQLEQDSLENGILFDPSYLAILDLLLTDALIRYAQALSGGNLSLAAAGSREGEGGQLLDRLQRSLEQDNLEALLTDLEPHQTEYLQLQQALLELRELSAFGGWPVISPGGTLRDGDRGERVQRLKARLFLSRDLDDPAAWEEAGIGRLTIAGIRQFQERHGLEADGVAGPLTLAELNVPVEERIRQVELNLLRLRQSPVDSGKRHIRVNIADFTLEVHEQGEIVMSMPVVVGTPYRMTPTFSAQLSYLEFAPYWYVPGTILREDKLPLIRRDPDWISRNHYEIVGWGEDSARQVDPGQIDWSEITSRNFPGTLRMLPGPWNPLGQVKFMFPNRYAVYLHDTNEQQLFSRETRLFSSGCIRIERPLDLAQYLLDGVLEWDCERIVSAMQGRETLKVYLPKKIPVHLLYWTAWVDDHERLQFRRDIYLRDADLEIASAMAAEQNRPEAGGRIVKADFSTSETPQ